jgi:hypothetical protein
MMKLKLVVVAGALALPGAAFAQTAPGTNSTGALGALSTFKASVLKVHEPSANDLARTRNGRLRKTDQELTNEMSVMRFFAGGTTGLHVEMRTGALDDGTNPVHRMQAACAPVQLTQDAAGAVALTKLPGERFVTDNDGEETRNANKPELLPINNGKNMLLMFNYRPRGANNTRRYAKVLDAQCNEVPLTNANGQTRKQVLIMQKDNDDCDMHQTGEGPGDVATDANGNTGVVLWAGCNGNGRDDGWANFVNVSCTNGATGASGCQITKVFDLSLARREERSRGRCSVGTDPNTAICTWTEGNNQPQRDGTWVAAIDLSANGQNGEDAQSRLLWKQQFDGRKDLPAVAGNNQTVRTYSVRMTQTRVMQEATDGSLQKTDLMILQAGDASGNNRNNKKGGTYRALQMAVVRATRTGMEFVVPKTDVTDLLAGIDGTHLTACPAVFGGGTDLIGGIGFLQGSHNGGGVVSPQFKGIGIDLTQNKFVDLGTRQAGGSYDRALYSNYLGNNPGNQGRNYAGCSLLKNPFAAAAGATTKYFIALAMNGKSPETVENAALKPASYVSLAPIATTLARGTHALVAEESNNEKSGCTAVAGKAGYESLVLLGLCLGLVRIARRRRA